MNKTLQTLVLFLIVAAGGAMRFHALDRQSLWDDEMSTVLTVTNSRDRIKNDFETTQVHPPLYFLQLKIWMKMTGSSLVKIRQNSAVWGTVSLLLIYFLGLRYLGAWGGFGALALMASSPLHLAYSQEARPYALAMVLGCAGLLALERYREKPGRGRWAALTGLWTCLLYTHYWGSFAVLGQALYGYFYEPTPERRKGIGNAFLVASVLFAFWLPILFAQMSVVHGLSFWVPPFSFLHPLKSLTAFTGLYFNVASFVFYLPTRLGILILLGIPFAILFAWGIFRGPIAAVSWLGVGISIPWLLSLYTAGIYVWYRYPVVVYPAFVLLVIAGALMMRPRALGAALMLICLGSQAWGCHFYFKGWEKANPKSVVSYIHTLRGKDTIVVRPAYFANLYNFYDRGETLGIDEHLLDSPEKRAALKGKTIIFVGFDAPDPVGAALLQEFKPLSGRYFPGYAHLGITVWQLQ